MYQFKSGRRQFFKMKNQDKFRGCLIGGAIGDALGYAVEFLQISRIRQKYGDNGITSYELKNGIAEISDDTQMTLFTANGLLIIEIADDLYRDCQVYEFQEKPLTDEDEKWFKKYAC